MVRECGRTIDSPLQKKISYTLDQSTYIDIVNAANDFASSELLKVLMQVVATLVATVVAILVAIVVAVLRRVVEFR